ncbi:hypothetical protein [uncultured Microscilla sp.]|uniref:hypothetical protein n=1 Tax=uncultured Microscilla sp. TaxID=432653 RepID=UPI0026154DD9|nr:hypothetical protein [uncultured Microscilla sp.]
MSNKNPKPKWLEHIQNNSWEPELFISGGIIFTLLQTTTFIQHQSFLLLQTNGYYETVVIANFLIAALNALIFGFGLHLVFRGFWVAAVCLSYVFPKGIQADKVGDYAPPFKQKVKKVTDTSVDLVVWMESASSTIFFLSFFLFSLIIGVLLALLIIIPHSGLRETWGETGFLLLKIGSGIMLLLGGVYLIDFLTLGLIKKQQKLTKIYYPIYWVFSILSLSFLYRSAYYALVTNIRRKWWFVIGVVVYMVVAFAITQFSFAGSSPMPALSFGNLNLKSYLGIQSNRYQFHTRQYENMRKKNDLVQHVSIQSDIIGSKYLKLFIVHQKAIERLMDVDCQQKKHYKVQAIRQRKMLHCYQNFYRIYIDNKRIPHLKWRYYQHPHTNERGIISLVPINHLTPSEHTVEVKLNVSTKKELEELKKFGMKDDIYAYIPFWKESK